jgi:hypothetical protein
LNGHDFYVLNEAEWGKAQAAGLKALRHYSASGATLALPADRALPIRSAPVPAFCRFTMLGFLRLLTNAQVIGDNTLTNVWPTPRRRGGFQ